MTDDELRERSARVLGHVIDVGPLGRLVYQNGWTSVYQSDPQELWIDISQFPLDGNTLIALMDKLDHLEIIRDPWVDGWKATAYVGYTDAGKVACLGEALGKHKARIAIEACVLAVEGKNE